MSKDLDTPPVLAFERKLDPSDALFHAGDWTAREASENWQPVSIREKSVRGTMSSRKQAKEVDTLKLDGNEKHANLQTVDVATLPSDTDTLKVRFTLRVLGGTGQPSACNDAAYREKLIATVDGYKQRHGFTELARRYAANLANGRFLWRNRIGAEQVEVQVAHLKDGAAITTWTFDALSHSLFELSAAPAESAHVQQLADLIASGLAGNNHVLLQVTAFARIGTGQEVFPSQELILDKGNSKKSKTLYDVDKVAAIHSQKIGNSLRTIDNWYSQATKHGPIAVEPYGSVTTLSEAFRQPKERKDFYSLLDSWILKDKMPELEQQHFVIATLIRGGVFGKKAD